MFELIDRRVCKARAAEVLRNASVPAKAMTVLYIALLLLLDLLNSMAGNNIIGSFITIFTTLLTSVLAAGFCLYCMAVRRGERAEYLTIFDGFSFVGKIVLLDIVKYFFVFLWSMLFVIPGVIALYRYSFAEFNLYENPGITAMEALDMSKRQTFGYKSQLFMLDVSYMGWGLLKLLPSMVVSMLMAYDYAYLNASLDPYAAILDPATYLGIPVWLWVLLIGLWGLAVSLFYYPNYICVQLDYFETAKSTSGVGKDPAPRNDTWDNWGNQGPDGLDSF